MRGRTRGASGLDRAPHQIWRRRHVQFMDAERRQRIKNGVHDGLRCGDAAGLPGSFYAEWIRCGRRRLVQAAGEVRQILRARQRVIHERTTEQLPLGVERDVLQQRLPDTLCDPAMHLSEGDAWIDQAAEVIRDRVAIEPHHAGLAFAVDDIDAAVASVRARGGELVDEVENYEDIYRLCYVRGPEGIIVELA